MKAIYKITNNITGESYIGESTNVMNRIKGHFNPNIKQLDRLHYDILIYGQDNFSWEILKELPINTDKKTRLNIESYYIDYYDTFNNGYNKTYFDDTGKQHWKAKDNTNYSEMYKNIFNLTYHLR